MARSLAVSTFNKIVFTNTLDTVLEDAPDDDLVVLVWNLQSWAQFSNLPRFFCTGFSIFLKEWF